MKHVNTHDISDVHADAVDALSARDLITVAQLTLTMDNDGNKSVFFDMYAPGDTGKAQKEKIDEMVNALAQSVFAVVIEQLLSAAFEKIVNELEG